MNEKTKNLESEQNTTSEINLSCEFVKISALSKQRRLHRNKINSRRARQSARHRRR